MGLFLLDLQLLVRLSLALLWLEMLWHGMLLFAGSVMAWSVVFGSVVTRKTKNIVIFKEIRYYLFC